MSDKPHLSASSLELFAKCPEAWRRRYVEGDVIPPRLAMLKGKAVHKAIELNMRERMATGESLPTDSVCDAARDAFKTECTGGYQLGDGESEAVLPTLQDQAVALAKVHAEEQAPDYNPVAVEHRFRIELPALSHDVVGIIDVVDASGAIADFKTSKKRYSEDEAGASLQLSLYAASQATTNPDPDGTCEVRLDVLVDATKTKPPSRQVVRSYRDRSDLPVIANRLAVVSKTITAELFPPAPTGAWWCSEGWCGYWHSCPYVNAARASERREIEQAIQSLTESFTQGKKA